MTVGLFSDVLDGGRGGSTWEEFACCWDVTLLPCTSEYMGQGLAGLSAGAEVAVLSWGMCPVREAGGAVGTPGLQTLALFFSLQETSPS